MKYIIVKDYKDDEYAIVFPDSIIHKDVARIHSATDDNMRVVSAGFCDLPHYTWGESESLKMKSRTEDAIILAKDFGKEPT